MWLERTPFKRERIIGHIACILIVTVVISVMILFFQHWTGQ